MKLRRIRLSNFRQFRQPFEVDALDDGINLFVGPNESGKTTLVHAIRAAFFERFNSSTLTDLQPWGDSGVAPEVEIDFDWDNAHWSLKKRFLRQSRCDLRRGTESWSGKDAEDKLATLLGFDFPGRGTSKPEHWGIPGLLWVQQGRVQDIKAPVESADQYLQAALGEDLGEVASSHGDALIETVRGERDELITKTGKPRGTFKQVIEDQTAAENDLAGLDERIANYRQQVDELGRLQAEQQASDQNKPWLVERQRAEEAQLRLDEVHGWQAQQDKDRAELASCEESLKLLEQQLTDFASGVTRLAERDQARGEARQAHEACQARKAQLEARLKASQQARDQANGQFRQTRKQAEQARIREQHDRLTAQLEERKATITQVRERQTILQALREEQQATALDVAQVEHLRQLETELRELKVRREAVATRLRWALDDDREITIGEDNVSGSGERALVRTTDIRLPGLGHLQLSPGGDDVAELARRQQDTETDLAELYQRLGVRSLDEARKRLAADTERSNKINKQQAHVEAMAPHGLDALLQQQELDKAKVTTLADQLAPGPALDEELPDEASAEAALDTADQALSDAEQAMQDWRLADANTRQALEAAEREWQQLADELASSDRKQREREAQTKQAKLTARRAGLQQTIEARQQKIDAAAPDFLAQDVERHEKSAQALQAEAATRRERINTLRTRLEALGADGLDEKRDSAAQALQQLKRRHAELKQRAEALDLLFNTLEAARGELTRQLQAPLQARLNHYLKPLFPGASLRLDEALIPETLIRPSDQGASETGDFDQFSYGAREQLGLISRLAYADLLHKAGKPTLVILDDALVHSDAARLEQMKKILHDAAQRHQILLLSCHPDNWHGLGVVARDMRALKAAEP